MPESIAPLEDPNPVVRTYARLARRYDSRWGFFIEATARETLARAPIAPEDRVLDVGCGTGALLERLATTHAPSRLAGVDPVSEMLAIAKERLPAAVDLRQGWAEKLPFDSESFDVVMSCNTLHYFRRPIEALREMARVLRPGGLLVITDWCDDYLACRVCDLYLRIFDRAHYKTYGTRGCETLVREALGGDVQVERYKIDRLWGLMTATARKRGGD
jgi:ubiquinone/menaquinone biosynthesis C-methylase UbiE